jgi:DNA polymerase III epsilon subunit-like protein
MSGKLYTIKIDKDYDFDGLLKYAEFLIQTDMNGSRPNADSLDINFLQSFGCDVPLNINNKKNKSKPQVIINTNINNFVIYYSDDDDDDNDKNNNNKKASPNKYMSFDVETGSTGMTSSIIQLGYIIYDDKFNEIKKVNKFIKNRDVEKRLFMIHGISIDYLNEHGCEFSNVIEEFLYDLYNCNAIIGHNVSSDMRHIKSNMEKYCDCYYLDDNELFRIHDPFNGKQFYDTMITGKIVMNSKKNAKLEDLYSYLFPGNIMENAHDALYDCKITADCCFKMMDIIERNKNKKPKIKSITEFICEKSN